MKWRLLGKFALGAFCILALAVVALENVVPNTMRRCNALEPGANESDLIEAVGEPIGEEIVDEDSWTLYPHPLASATPVLARIDPKTREILSLWCDQANRPRNW